MQKDSLRLYDEYKRLSQTAADLNYASAVLGWDQEVYMPAKGADARARQLATLSTEAHSIMTGERMGQVLRELASVGDAALTPEMQANVRLSLLDYEKNSKLSSAFVEELSLLTSNSFNAWVDARRKNDHRDFLPYLDKMIALKRRQADMYGYEVHPYDALLNDYERGSTVAATEPVFALVRKEFPALLKMMKNARQVDDSCMKGIFPKQQQWDFSLHVLRQMGFDFEAGRQDYSEHPFTTSFSPGDVRITTRVDEHNFASMLWSSIHEGGHGLYEQGLPDEQYGLPLGEAASLSIHESQSRLWENCVGRGADFWEYAFPVLKQYFPEQLGAVDKSTFYKACNRVSPSLIRTEADEVTYHFHVMIRFELEKALMDGSLSAADLPGAWNDQFEKYLGIRPADDKTGVLQDVHWSHGMFGYFPTYSLGSFYAVQFFEQASRDIAGLESLIKCGEFGALLQWLRTHVHQYGRQYTSDELCRRITGKSLDPMIFVAYARKKYSGIYLAD